MNNNMNAKTNTISSEISERAALESVADALKNLEGCFDRWYCDSEYLCECIDKLKSKHTSELQNEVLRLQNLLVASISARTALANLAAVRAKGGAK